ncbi:MAG: hypothetical protein BAJALOKI1v1_250029 [Promethearchaeota archaeon]|nr:MAG: hypothetical protein BAJALOKI1v1_250029 [Candidatus Lokiarchaeota archaeon]
MSRETTSKADVNFNAISFLHHYKNICSAFLLNRKLNSFL